MLIVVIDILQMPRFEVAVGGGLGILSVPGEDPNASLLDLPSFVGGQPTP